MERIRYQKMLCFLGKDTSSPVLKDEQKWPGKEKVKEHFCQGRHLEQETKQEDRIGMVAGGSVGTIISSAHRAHNQVGSQIQRRKLS